MHVLSYRRFLQVVIGISIICFFFSLWQISHGNIGGFEPFTYVFGFLLYSAFIWADVFFFSFLWILLGFILLRIKDRAYFWIAFFSFWLIRSIGEVFYSLLQQFNPDVRPYVGYLPRSFLFSGFSPYVHKKYWVVEQVWFQIIAIGTLFGLIYMVIKVLKKK